MNVGDFPILSLITFLPLAGALVVALIPRRHVGAIRGAALGSSLAAWVAASGCSLGYLPGRRRPAPGWPSSSWSRSTGSRSSGSSTSSASTGSRWRWSS